MTQTGSDLLNVIAWIALGVAFASAAAILFDIVIRRRRERMAVMNWV